MSARPFTHAEATADRGLQHVSEFIPEPLKEATRLARMVKDTKGQSHHETTKAICRLLLEGLE